MFAPYVVISKPSVEMTVMVMVVVMVMVIQILIVIEVLVLIIGYKPLSW